jgi:hypothetical protein
MKNYKKNKNGIFTRVNTPKNNYKTEFFILFLLLLVNIAVKLYFTGRIF